MARLTEAWRGGDALGERPGWRLRFDFEQDTIDRLKATVPPAGREWHPELKWWWVSQAYEGELLRLFPNFRAFRDQARLF